MIFLEYLARQLLGPPIVEGSDPYWDCPSCQARSEFHIMPHKPPHKDRWKCFACGKRGDAYDLLQTLEPKRRFNSRKIIVRHHQRTFKRLKTQGRIHQPAPTFFSSGTNADYAEEAWLLEKIAEANVKENLYLERLALYKNP